MKFAFKVLLYIVLLIGILTDFLPYDISMPCIYAYLALVYFDCKDHNIRSLVTLIAIVEFVFFELDYFVYIVSKYYIKTGPIAGDMILNCIILLNMLTLSLVVLYRQELINMYSKFFGKQSFSYFPTRADSIILISTKVCTALYISFFLANAWTTFKFNIEVDQHLKEVLDQQLIDDGKAYYAFDTPEELDAMRERLKAAGGHSQQYDSKSRDSMRNSLTLSEEEVQKRIAAGDKYVVRAKILPNEEVKFKDSIRGWVSVDSSNLDDKVLFKSDGMPTYHMANVVDDYLMKITHVIRGEEWLPSGPLHVLLYKFLGWEAAMPEFAHLPLILKPNGNGKLSKRDGDAGGFPVFPIEWNSPEGDVASGYRESGYFPEAHINMLAFLGWNPGTEQELFSLEELVNEFSLERVGKSGAKFDPDKTKWFNEQYLRAKSNEELAQIIKVS